MPEIPPETQNGGRVEEIRVYLPGTVCPDVSKYVSKSDFQAKHINFIRIGNMQEDPGQTSPPPIDCRQDLPIPLKHLQSSFSVN